MLTDLLSGDAFEVRTRGVVDATGRLGGRGRSPVLEPLDSDPAEPGAHLVVPRERIPARTGVTIRVPGKVVFLVPWPDSG